MQMPKMTFALTPMPDRTRLAALLLPWLVATSALADVAVGAPSPGFEATLLDGSTTLRSTTLQGKVVLVNFWATWCAPCMTEMPLLDDYYKKHKAEGLEVIAISMDAPKDLDKVRAYARQYSFPIAHKNDANIKAFGRIWRLPSTFVIDPHGTLSKNGHEGDPELSRELLDTLVSPLLTPH